jgi:hypothetical protein
MRVAWTESINSEHLPCFDIAESSWRRIKVSGMMGVGGSHTGDYNSAKRTDGCKL